MSVTTSVKLHQDEASYKTKWKSQPARTRLTGYLIAAFGTLLATAALAPFRESISTTTVALTLLLNVLFAATRWGSWPAMLASGLGVLCFNFFFLPPVHTLTIDDPQNWMALAAFLITAVTVGELSARVKRRAVEAEARRIEIERLYQEYRAASERAKQAEVYEQSERLKSALLDAVTHDMRTPLTSIKASVTTLLYEIKGDDDLMLHVEDRRELLEVINEEADRMNHFIENMVELARIEAGAIHLRRRWISVEEIIAMARARAGQVLRDHRLENSLERDLPAARVDAHLLAEVLYSLIDNAIKNSPPGSSIRVIARREGDDMILFAVEDEGPGVPPELRERVFDKFYRALDEVTPRPGRPKGLGMGLAIARGIVEAHGGRIWIESGANGRGARVAFTAPIGDEGATESE